MNQALFEGIWVWHENQIRTELASPFKELQAISKAIRASQTTPSPATQEQALPDENDEATGANPASDDFVVGSISRMMVELEGLEPSTSAMPWRRSPS
jgi:hypothetical protein